MRYEAAPPPPIALVDPPDDDAPMEPFDELPLIEPPDDEPLMPLPDDVPDEPLIDPADPPLPFESPVTDGHEPRTIIAVCDAAGA